MLFDKRLHIFTSLALCCAVLFNSTHVSAEIYKWVDEKGKVHLSDKRSASDSAIRIDNQAPKNSKDGNQFRFSPDADAMLRENQHGPKGESPYLSVGYWKSGRGVHELVSIIRFDISDLLAELNTNKKKSIRSAQLDLFANTTDIIHGKNSRSDSPKGHYNKQGDNAFYVKAALNNWDEHSTTWQQFYGESSYTPVSIRTLPSAEVHGSAGDSNLDYSIDLLEMLTKAAEANMREITLELRLQRRASMSIVSFYSREAEQEKRPMLLVKLKEK